MKKYKKVMVIGLDGLEPSITQRLMEAGEMPNLATIRNKGGYATVATTYPAQTPVAWSTFATGVNPGGHGIYDFLRRDPNTYLPDLSLNRYEQKNAFVPPRAVNLRQGTPVWEYISKAGMPSVIVRCPCTYPPDKAKGRMLSGLGVPDIRGGLGTSTFYTTETDAKPKESEHVIHLPSDGNGKLPSYLIGPRNPKERKDVQLPITIHIDSANRKAVIKSDGKPGTLEVPQGQWSDWLKVKFKIGMLQSVRGMVRFYLVETEPHVKLYASPINFDPQQPMFPICSPFDYAVELEETIGTFYTTGMVEDHNGLNNGRIDEAAFLQQCDRVMAEREGMMLYELNKFKEGLFYCLYDTPDRIQHMFWRFTEPDHPANNGAANPDFARVIEDHYKQCDAVVGKALQYADEDTLFIVLSDHGFNTFRRGFHVNTWLHDNGFLTLKNGIQPGPENGDFFPNVDWSRTKAYSLGLAGIYLNVKGREANGIVKPEDMEQVKQQIIQGLSGIEDAVTGRKALRSVLRQEQVYSGDYLKDAPDLVLNFSAGYRSSWETGLGGIPKGHFEDNRKRWSGDHIIDPLLVPGVLFMNHSFNTDNPGLIDLAPTILAALGVPKGEKMEGKSLLS